MIDTAGEEMIAAVSLHTVIGIELPAPTQASTKETTIVFPHTLPLSSLLILLFAFSQTPLVCWGAAERSGVMEGTKPEQLAGIR